MSKQVTKKTREDKKRLVVQICAVVLIIAMVLPMVLSVMML